MIDIMKQGLGHRTPQQESYPGRAQHFQESKMCGHGMILALLQP